MELRDKPTVAEGIKTCERTGMTRFVVYEPGNNTRYRLLITSTFEFSSEARQDLGVSNGYVVSFPGSILRTIIYSAGSYLASSSFCSNVGCSLAEAVVLCELLAYLTDCQAITCEKYREIKNEQ